MNGTLAGFLLDLSARSGAEGLDAWTLRLGARREDLAGHLGLTLEALELEFARLVASRTIVRTGDIVTILDRRALATWREASADAARRETAGPAKTTGDAPARRGHSDGTTGCVVALDRAGARPAARTPSGPSQGQASFEASEEVMRPTRRDCIVAARIPRQPNEA